MSGFLIFPGWFERESSTPGDVFANGGVLCVVFWAGTPFVGRGKPQTTNPEGVESEDLSSVSEMNLFCMFPCWF